MTEAQDTVLGLRGLRPPPRELRGRMKLTFPVEAWLTARVFYVEEGQMLGDVKRTGPEFSVL